MTASSRYILHADLDAFYASVEQRDNPSLKGKPVVVGGAPESRGVVAAASYEARKYGIRSATAMRTAMKLCPELVRIPPRFDRYREVSEQIMKIYRALTPLVQPLSLDEAYLDISDEVAPEEWSAGALQLKNAVMEKTGLVVTIGGGTSKTVAKIASRVAKPDGLLLVRPGEEESFLSPLPSGLMWGVGPKTEELLKRHGVLTIGDMAKRGKAWMLSVLGNRGSDLWKRSHGIDDAPVSNLGETKSVSAETTMTADVDNETVLVGHVERLARQVSVRLEKGGLKGTTVYVKLRLSDFTTFTRQMRLAVPTSDAKSIGQAACSLLKRELMPQRKFRLIGVGVRNFQCGLQLPLTGWDLTTWGGGHH